ncbi:MAG: hypothetical protein RSE24_05375 [Oscillospiraceae bacterium]
MQKKKKAKYSKKVVIVIAILLIVTALFIFADIRLRPEIATVARYKIQGLMMKAVNDAIIKQMQEKYCL